MENKIKTREEIKEICEKLKKKGKKIVSTNGSFDIFHYGHVLFLKEAKKQGDLLIVGINSDASVKGWKKKRGYSDWNKRPLNSQEARVGIISSIKYVDYVTVFDEIDPFSFIESIKPNIHVNGSEYGEKCIESSKVKELKGKLHIIPIKEGYSTSKLIKKILKAYKDD